MSNQKPLVYALLLLPLAAFVAGCQTGPLKDIKLFEPKPEEPATAVPEAEPAATNTAQLKLAVGVSNYDEGNYKSAALNLQDALDAGLPDMHDQVKAHKYLAFMHCAAKREKLCQDEFTLALEINPQFELAPAEAGHPVWGRVFRNVKKAMAAKQP